MPAIMLLLTALAPLAGDLIAFWTTAKTTLAQADELTPELEAALDAEIEKLNPANPDLAEKDKQQPL